MRDKDSIIYTHRSVLLNDAINALVWCSDGIYVDGTFGMGGHSRLILDRLNRNGKLLAFDKDPQAVAEARRLCDARFNIVHDSFSKLYEWVSNFYGQDVRISGVILDLGMSSHQLDNPSRGFSFLHNGPLDMRMDNTRGKSASEWLWSVSKEELEKVIRDYGQEQFSNEVAKSIIAYQENIHAPIRGTCELAEIVARTVKTHTRGRNPATRTFQAIRIHINRELEDLEIALQSVLNLLDEKGRLVVISFHSLEDRIVKKFIRSHMIVRSVNQYDPLYLTNIPKARLKLIGKFRPSIEEIRQNRRARSAIMRVAEKILA